jgi:predicted nucleic acid-binding Zn ribbon protein
MPKYDYFCEANGTTVEVSHPMKDRLTTWGELCARSGQDLGATPADAPVKKLITGGGVVKASSLKNPALPPCQMGAPCSGGSCGF